MKAFRPRSNGILRRLGWAAGLRDVNARLDKLESRIEEGRRLQEKHLVASVDTIIDTVVAHVERAEAHVTPIHDKIERLRTELTAEIDSLKLAVTGLAFDSDISHISVTDPPRSLDDLIEAVPELYQDIKIGGQLIHKGLRDCEGRSVAILEAIEDRNVVLDLGSSFGYFSKEIALSRPNSLVVSVEADGPSAALQRHLLQLDEVSNVVLVHGALSQGWIQSAIQACTFFDTLLALSVLHHFPAEGVVETLRGLDRLARKLVIETVHEQESRACGVETSIAIKQAGGPKAIVHNQQVTTLGHFPSHLHSDIKREMLMFEDMSFRRKSSKAYIASQSHKGPGAYEFWHEDGRWRFNKEGVGRDYAPGINLWDIRQLGRVLWPSPEVLVEQFDRLFEDKGGRWPTDIRPWNLAYTADGLRLIDSTEHGVPESWRDRDRVRLWLATLNI